MAMKSLKEKCSNIVQSAREKGENGMGGSSTVTVELDKLSDILAKDSASAPSSRALQYMFAL